MWPVRHLVTVPLRLLGDESLSGERWPQVRVGRSYGRVCRRRLRDKLLSRCVAAGVSFLAAEVAGVKAEAPASSATLLCVDGSVIRSRRAHFQASRRKTISVFQKQAHKTFRA